MVKIGYFTKILSSILFVHPVLHTCTNIRERFKKCHLTFCAGCDKKQQSKANHTLSKPPSSTNTFIDALAVVAISPSNRNPKLEAPHSAPTEWVPSPPPQKSGSDAVSGQHRNSDLSRRNTCEWTRHKKQSHATGPFERSLLCGECYAPSLLIHAGLVSWFPGSIAWLFWNSCWSRARVMGILCCRSNLGQIWFEKGPNFAHAFGPKMIKMGIEMNIIVLLWFARIST